MVSSVHMEPVSRSDQYKRVMKPLLERKRRARINRCLDELRDLLVTVLQSEGEAVTRLEKADILELTVRHVRRLSQVRRLALPNPRAIQQQDREDVEKFQQGFVAAAHQVQSFLMSTPLEPSVSTRLLSHLSNYATSITPPAVSPSTNPTASPVSHPPAPSAVPPRPLPQQSQQSPPIANYHTLAPPSSVSPPTQPRIAINSAPQQGSVPSTQSVIPRQQLPLVDLSNRQLPPPPPPPPVPAEGNHLSSRPVIRDVRCEDRTVAPSPFIDVVSTIEPEDVKPTLPLTKIPPVESTPRLPVPTEAPPPKSLDNITLHLQAKVVASMSVPEFQVRNSVRHHPYHLPKKLAISRQCSSPVPEDLSMKKPSDGDKNSWRPW